MNRHARTSRGFTIVELLIVVVIIAILAAITLVTYNGVQQRATNTAIIDAASKSLRMIQAYIAANDKYPIATSLCITASSGCANSTGTTIPANSTFDTNIAAIGTMPKSIPTSGSDRYGIIYDYMSNRTMNGLAQPYALLYYLQGINQQCGVTGVTDSFGPTMFTSSAGYTSGNSGGTSGKTACVITIPGPIS